MKYKLIGLLDDFYFSQFYQVQKEQIIKLSIIGLSSICAYGSTKY